MPARDLGLRMTTTSATNVDTIIFDWGGTLSVWAEVEISDMWRLAADHIAGETGADSDDLVATLVEVEDELWEQNTKHDYRSFTLADIFRTASARLEVDVGEAVLEEAAMRHLDRWTSHVSHDPEAAQTLAALAKSGLRLGLLSNTHWPEAWHEHFLERDGLLDHLHARVYSSNERHMKPHPDIFRLVLDRLDANPATTLMVGDRQLDDIYGAQQVGMRAVWKHTRLAKSWPGVEPDFEIQRLPELFDLIQGRG